MSSSGCSGSSPGSYSTADRSNRFFGLLSGRGRSMGVTQNIPEQTFSARRKSYLFQQGNPVARAEPSFVGNKRALGFCGMRSHVIGQDTLDRIHRETDLV